MWKKDLLPVLTKQLFLPNSFKTSGRFFINFVAFSENLNFTWGSLSTTSILKPSITLCINQKATEHPIAPPPTTIISYWASKPLIKNKSIIELVLFQTPIHSFWIPPFAKPFWENIFYFIERGIFASNCKFSNKNDLLCIWRDFNKTFCGIFTYRK